MAVLLEFQQPPGKPLLRGQDHYWQVICALDTKGPWTVHEIDLKSRTKARGTITHFVKRLVAGGIAEPTGETRVHRNLPTPTYRLLKRPTATPCLNDAGQPSRAGRTQLQLWNTLRGSLGRGGITIEDLALFSSTDAVPVPRESARRYVGKLEKAGYLVVTGREPKTVRLKPDMNTGPRPPAVIDCRMIYDRNRGIVVGPVVAEEARP